METSTKTGRRLRTQYEFRTPRFCRRSGAMRPGEASADGTPHA